MKQNTKRFLTAIAAALMVTASFTACGCESKSKKASATADETTSVIKDDEPEFTTIALDETEQAIADQGLTVNDKGEVVDANGSKVETTEEGNVKVTTADGQTVEVNVDKVKQTTKKTTENSKFRVESKLSINTKTIFFGAVLTDNSQADIKQQQQAAKFRTAEFFFRRLKAAIVRRKHTKV